ncbi:uncharacterized protein RSE6_00690 [Rhynchosporium secalis]|uniref:Uncharacterized protein n=1 Tax=Rhynchosporium secalis TaxID=38038 RepID=A0A1E1LVZ9_RHYSE|nr:uncharacterized protein RSE6_00690 [Rhynchosporium secalis]
MADYIKSKGPTLHTLKLLKNYKGHTKSFSNTSSQLGCRRTGAAGLVKEKRSSHTQHAQLHTAPLHSRRCLLLYALTSALHQNFLAGLPKLFAQQKKPPERRPDQVNAPISLQQHDQPMRLFTDTANKRH